jgi:hypothetical protein
VVLRLRGQQRAARRQLLLRLALALLRRRLRLQQLLLLLRRRLRLQQLLLLLLLLAAHARRRLPARLLCLQLLHVRVSLPRPRQLLAMLLLLVVLLLLLLLLLLCVGA